MVERIKLLSTLRSLSGDDVPEGTVGIVVRRTPVVVWVQFKGRSAPTCVVPQECESVNTPPVCPGGHS